MTSMIDTLPEVDFGGPHMVTLKALLRGEAVDLDDAWLAMMVLAMHLRNRRDELEHEDFISGVLMRDPSQWHALSDDHA